MQKFFSYIRQNRRKIIADFGGPLDFCILLATEGDKCGIPKELYDLLRVADADDRDYAIASAYALLIGDERRKAISAYFTPPALARAAMDASAAALDEMDHPAVLDPACGGGSFLTPVARALVEQKTKNGISVSAACKSVLSNLRGIEIDAGLATLSQTLLRNMLAREYDYTAASSVDVVTRADALSARNDKKFDLVIGNPPFGRVRQRVSPAQLERAGAANIGGHTNLYSLFLLRGLDWVKPSGGLVFVLPTSFVAGPYFAGLRQEILARAEVVRIDLHEQRDNLFLGAVQDVCLLTLRRRQADYVQPADLTHEYELGIIEANGQRSPRGTGSAKPNGEPWSLPSLRPSAVQRSRKTVAPSPAPMRFVLADYGYRVRVGKVVPTRERERLHTRTKKGCMPLVWASSIRPDGRFEFDAAKRLGNAVWYKPLDKNVPYATTRPAVIIQRTSNREQRRRLNAAFVPVKFRNEHPHGFVAENHVIVIEATVGRPKLAPSLLTKLLNSEVVNERFSTVSGSFSVSAKLLQAMAFPHPERLRALDKKRFEQALRSLFADLGDVLVSAHELEAARDAQNAIDKPSNRTDSLTIDEEACLKGRAVA